MKKLAAREKILIVAAAIGLMAALFYAYVMSPAIDELKKLDAKIPYMERQYRAVRRISDRCEQINSLISKVQDKLDKREGNFQPRAFLDKLAKQVGMDKGQLKEIKPIKSTIENDVYKEERFGVKLKKINIKDLVNYLYKIESSEYLLTVRELRIDPDKREPNLLNAKFEVSTFTRKAPEAGS